MAHSTPVLEIKNPSTALRNKKVTVTDSHASPLTSPLLRGMFHQELYGSGVVTSDANVQNPHQVIAYRQT